ncbi:MAG TPA: type I phosphomannose isomerase catalytic subunit [Phycisphaerales bacterium]|nr:type I phosphomannose isomerase catalytic subunit [Phycisphaerales bacterium]
MTTPSPLLLRPQLFEKVWGGDALRAFGKDVAPGSRIGESWELADLDATSASGAGGGAVRSVIANGPLAGKSVRDAAAMWGEDLLGTGKPTRAGGFPLLVKFLDARENLSVQVHPSHAYARTHADAHLKTECWYILGAKPGAVIYKGVRPGVTRERFGAALREGDGSGVVELLGAVPAAPGEMHNLPSGTVHALGAGVVVAEVQTPSDTTFRVYDWGRKGRALHVQESLECIQWEEARDATRLAPGERSARLVTTGYFDVDGLTLAAGETVELREEPTQRRPQVVVCLSGGGVIHAGAVEETRLSKGDTVLIPAACCEEAVLAASGASSFLRAVVR